MLVWSRTSQVIKKPYKKETAHHPHTGAKAGEEHGLVSGNHPLATGLQKGLSAVSLNIAIVRCYLAPVCDACPPTSCSSAIPPLRYSEYAPSPMSSGHRASGTRAGSAAHGSRGRPSCLLSVSCHVRESGGGQPRPSRAVGGYSKGLVAAESTYPAIVKSGDVFGVVCGCNGCVGGS